MRSLLGKGTSVSNTVGKPPWQGRVVIRSKGGSASLALIAHTLAVPTTGAVAPLLYPEAGTRYGKATRA